MKVLEWKVLRLFGLMVLLLGLSGALAYAAQPIGNVIEDMQGQGWEDVVDRATWEGQTDGPMYPNAPPSIPAYETFEGDFTPQNGNTRIAVLSDDGSDLYVNDVKVLSLKGQGQALPNLSQSLHKVPFTFEAGRTYRLRLEYSNTTYLGSSDIDGATLFLYSKDPNDGVQVEFVSGLTGGVVRACAGGVGNDGVHSASLQVLAKRDGQILPNAELAFSFEGNVGNPKKAQFINEQGQSVETLTKTTDSEGKTGVAVLSSDTVSAPRIVVKYAGEEVGSVTCDFAKMISLRRFGLTQFSNQEDKGWIFDSGVLTQPGQTTPAKIYLKFQIDPSIPIDTNYFNADGTPRTLSDNGNWKVVNGHRLKIKVVAVTPQAGAEITGELNEYATLLDANNQPVASLEITTANDGAAQFKLQAGPLIRNAQTIVLSAENLTQN